MMPRCGAEGSGRPSRPARWIVLLPLVGMVACLDPRIEALVPEGVDWVTVLEQPLEGIKKSPLRRVDEVPVFGAVRGAPKTALGFSESQLGPLFERAEPGAIQAPLVFTAGVCEPRLPVPRWAAVVREESSDVAEVDPSGLPELSSNLFSATRCDGAELVAAVRCTGEPIACPVEITPTENACEHDFVPCVQAVHGRTTLRLRENGVVCDLGLAEGCEVTSPRSEALARWECSLPEACSFDIYQVPEKKPLAVELRVPLVDQEPKAPSRFDGGMKRESLYAGYVGDFIVRGDELVVGVYAGWRDLTVGCDRSAKGTLQFRSARDGALVRTATAPPCLTQIVAGPGEKGLFGLYFSSSGLSLAQLDDQGELLESYPLQEGLPAMVSAAPGGLAWTELEGTPRLAVFYFDQGVQLKWSVGVFFDLVGGRLERAFSAVYEQLELENGQEFFDAIALPTGRIAVANAEGSSVVWIDPRTGESLGASGLLPAVGRMNPTNLSYQPDTQRVVAASVSRVRTLAVIGEDMLRVRSTMVFEGEGRVTASAPWPLEEGQTAVVAFDDGRSSATLLDTRSVDLRVGAIDLGLGYAPRARASSDAVWVLLPWEGALVRLGPSG